MILENISIRTHNQFVKRARLHGFDLKPIVPKEASREVEAKLDEAEAKVASDMVSKLLESKKKALNHG